jgi:thymidylate synthase
MVDESQIVILGENFDDVFADLLYDVSNYPQFVCSPRGQKIKETLAKTVVLVDPRARLICNPAREANFGFMAGEFLWYWQGRSDLDMMLYYNKRMGDFSDDGVTLNSAYGKRILTREESISQWEACVKTLSEDTDSRRALMLINQPHDNIHASLFGSKDVPCTLSLQFFIRENNLHLHVHMRSNDVIWGLTNDLFSFTMLQECMLLELKETGKFSDLQLGTYYHTAGSMHLYERHFELADRILAGHLEMKKKNYIYPMSPLMSLDELRKLCRDEEELRKGYIKKIDLTKYRGACNFLAEQLNAHRQKRDAEESLKKEKEAIR